MNVIPFPVRESLDRDVSDGLGKEVMSELERAAAWLDQTTPQLAGMHVTHQHERTRGRMMLTCMYLDMAGIVLAGRGFARGDISSLACAGKCLNIGNLQPRQFECPPDAPDLQELAGRICAANELLARVAELRRRILRIVGGSP